MKIQKNNQPQSAAIFLDTEQSHHYQPEVNYLPPAANYFNPLISRQFNSNYSLILLNNDMWTFLVVFNFVNHPQYTFSDPVLCSFIVSCSLIVHMFVSFMWHTCTFLLERRSLMQLQVSGEMLPEIKESMQFAVMETKH